MERLNTVNRSTIRLEAIRMVMEELTQMLMPLPLQMQQLMQELMRALMRALMRELIQSLVRTAILVLFRNQGTILEMLQLLPSERTILS